MNELDNRILNKIGFAWRDLIGQDKWETSWTPTRTGWTDVGAPAVTGRFRVIGRKCEFQVKVVPSTTVATTAGTSYIGLPVAVAGIAGEVNMYNGTGFTPIGTNGIDVTNSRGHLPTQVATADTLLITGSYEV